MRTDTGTLMVVQTCSTQFAVIQLESQWLNQVQAGSGVSAQTDNVTRIRWDFRLVQNNI